MSSSAEGLIWFETLVLHPLLESVGEVPGALSVVVPVVVAIGDLIHVCDECFEFLCVGFGVHS